MEYEIETIELNDIEWVEDVAYDVTKYAYLVKTKEGKPICMFDYYWQAERFVKEQAGND